MKNAIGNDLLEFQSTLHSRLCQLAETLGPRARVTLVLNSDDGRVGMGLYMDSDSHDPQHQRWFHSVSLPSALADATEWAESNTWAARRKEEISRTMAKLEQELAELDRPEDSLVTREEVEGWMDEE